MGTKRLSNEFMEKILNDAAWKELAENFKWTEQILEKYKDKVDWKEISENREILWTPSMLEKFKNRIDWKRLSSAAEQPLLNTANLERFKKYWDWSEISRNDNLPLSMELIDKFLDWWDWGQLIDRYGTEDIYSFEFLEKYMDKIPTHELQESRLWNCIVKIRRLELAYEIIS